MASRKNFPSARKARLQGVSERLTKQIAAPKPEAHDEETHARKKQIAKSDLEKVTARLAALS